MTRLASVDGWQRKIRLMLFGLCVAVGSAMILLPGDAVWAGEGGRSRWEELKRREKAEAEREVVWRKRHEKKLRAIENAQKLWEEAEAAATWRNRELTRQRVERAQAALKKAEEDLEDFYEEARRESVPPGWVRRID
jgi:hypothetical protein